MDLQKADLIDYALPLIKIERLAKDIHDLCLEQRYEEARINAQLLCVEGRMLQHTLQLMDEQQRS